MLLRNGAGSSIKRRYCGVGGHQQRVKVISSAAGDATGVGLGGCGHAGQPWQDVLPHYGQASAAELQRDAKRLAEAAGR